MKTLPLHTGWRLKRRDSSRPLDDDLASGDWLPARVPGVVHQDLLEAGHILDPFYGLNELESQWVGEADWLYRLEFTAPELEPGEAAELCFEGLDTFARVWLNGEPLLESANMFVPHRVPVGEQLRPGGNDLVVLFESALRRGRALEALHGRGKLWNGDSSRLHVRKAQYHYGWDWGPTLLTAGPWRPVRLEVFEARLAELECPVEVDDILAAARFPVRARLAAAGGLEGASLRLRLLGPGGDCLQEALLPAATTVEHAFVVEKPRLWWPHTHGEQPLYRLEARLERGGRALDEGALRLGVRRLRLVQEPVEGETGSSFYFEVNNTPVFCGGANWIPDDSFLPRITPGRYRERLGQARDANMAMVRVWGGGIYEDDAFYDACDELGLLVWQDFMFACGLYPSHGEFQENVRREAEAAVRRLRHRPSLAIWCGNNEDYQIAYALGAYGSDAAPGAFPARDTYERLLPEVCAALDPSRPYWPGSPYLGDDPQDQTRGDRHTWDVWHGAMAETRDYPKHGGRFVSEFGMQALPALTTVEGFAPPEERFPASRTLEHHNKASDGPRRLNTYLTDALPIPADLPGYVYASQLVQTEALLSAYSGWRRRWGGPGRRAVAGALVWQLNDCWPVTSWAVIDSAGLPKPAYYAIRRALAPVAVGLAREGNGVVVWAVSDAREPLEAELELRVLDLAGAELARERRRVRLAANGATELGGLALPEVDGVAAVVAARLLRGETVLARGALWPWPFKHLPWPDPGLSATLQGPDAVRLTTERPVKGLWLEAADPAVRVRWSDNMLDLLPGEARLVRAEGLGGAGLALRWLGGERQVAGEEEARPAVPAEVASTLS